MDILKNMFLTRMSRKSFWWRFLLCNIAAILIVSLTSTFQEITRVTSSQFFSNEAEFLIKMLLIIIIAFYQSSLTVRRCHDADLSWGLTIVAVIMAWTSYTGIIAFPILAFIKGTKGCNKFGAEPGIADSHEASYVDSKN